MHHDRVMRADGIEDLKRASARDHEVLGEFSNQSIGGVELEDLHIMRTTQTDAKAE